MRMFVTTMHHECLQYDVIICINPETEILHIEGIEDLGISSLVTDAYKLAGIEVVEFDWKQIELHQDELVFSYDGKTIEDYVFFGCESDDDVRERADKIKEKLLHIVKNWDELQVAKA